MRTPIKKAILAYERPLIMAEKPVIKRKEKNAETNRSRSHNNFVNRLLLVRYDEYTQWIKRESYR
jgi:hypothetical protein